MLHVERRGVISVDGCVVDCVFMLPWRIGKLKPVLLDYQLPYHRGGHEKPISGPWAVTEDTVEPYNEWTGAKKYRQLKIGR